ncbi:MAG: META domain-containing protein [Rhodanobacter sp.]
MQWQLHRLLGSYVLKGVALSIHPAGTTMMACPAALMDQERRLLKILLQVHSAAIDGKGALVLKATGGTSITARRQ